MWSVGKAHTPHIPFPSSRMCFFLVQLKLLLESIEEMKDAINSV